MVTPQTSQLPWEFRGVVRVTKVGTTYILATLILTIAAVNTGNNSLYIAVAFMLGCLLLSGFASRGGLNHLEIEAGGIEEAWAGRPAAVTLHIRNGSRIWNVRDVVLTSNALAAPIFVPLIATRSDTAVPATFLFARRGIARVSTVDSYTRYPFGFFIKKRRLSVDSELVVFPRINDQELTAEQFDRLAGDQNSANRKGPGSEIHSFRNWQHGDSLRQVHWKKSASMARWIIKQTDADATHSVHVFVDPYKPRDVSDADFEEMISSAATFVFHAARRGLDVTLSLPGLSVRARETEAPAPLFHTLALVEPTFERVDQIAGPDAVVFALPGGERDAKSA